MNLSINTKTRIVWHLSSHLQNIYKFYRTYDIQIPRFKFITENLANAPEII